MITAIIAALGFGCYASGAITGSWAAFTSKMANLLDPRHLTRVAGAGDLISRGFQKLCEVFGLQPLKDNAKVVTDIWKKVAKVPPVRERPVPVVLTLQGDSQ